MPTTEYIAHVRKLREGHAKIEADKFASAQACLHCMETLWF